MPSEISTRTSSLRLCLALSAVFGLTVGNLTAAPEASTSSLLSVVSTGAASTRLKIDLTTTNPVAGVDFNAETGTAGELVRWVLIPPNCGVSLSLHNVVSETASSAPSDLVSARPAEFARLGEPAILRGYRMVPIYISPFAQDETGRSIRKLESAEFELDFSSSENRVNLVNQTLPPRPSRYARKLVEQLVVNPPPPSRDEDPAGGSILYVLGEWDDVEQALQPLIEWRRRMGWKVQTLRVGDNRSQPDVLAAIQDVYNNAAVTPEYIVLVGDAPGMRNNRYVLAFENKQSGARFPYESDQPYVCLEGDDLLPDAALGRLPFNTIRLLEGMVAKTVSYEATPYIGRNNNERGWQKRLMVAATDSRSGTSSLDLCNWFKDLTASHGFTRSYELFYTPRDPQPDPTDFITDNVSAGVSFFLYRGWSDMSGYRPDAPAQLRNELMLPFVMLATCNTGEYAVGHEGVSDWTYTESFFTNANGGAIGAVGAAGATHTAYNNILAAGTLAAPFTQEIYSQGWALQQGKLQMMHAYQEYDDINHEENRNMKAWLTEYYIFNLMGDPAVELVTDVPREITILNEAQIRAGETYYEVDLVYTDDRTPVSNAVVCLYKADSFQVVQRTNSDGHARFTLDPEWTREGTVKLTVTGRNLIPRLVDLQIAQAANMIGVETWTLDDDNNGESAGNGDGTANPTERLEVTIHIKNFGQQRPNGEMAVLLESLSPFVTVLTDTLRFESAPARNDHVTAVFMVEVAADCNDGFETGFRLKASAGGQDFFSSFSISLTAPALEFASVRWNGTILRPGATAEMYITLNNFGTMDAPAMNAELISLSSTVDVNVAGSTFPSIRHEQSGISDGLFQLSADRWHIHGQSANLALVLSSESGLRDSVFFSIPVGTATATTPFGPDRYGYICVDDTDTGWVTRPAYNWVELNPREGGQGTNLNLVDLEEEADASTLIDLSFEFTYYGETFSTLTVCTNGWAAFGDHHTLIGGRNRRIPCSELVPAMLCPFWDDLITTANGGVFVLSDAQNHRFIIQWSLMRKLGPQGQGEPLETFEIILYDPAFLHTPTGDGEIVFLYEDVNDAQSCFQTWDTPFATVGIGSLDCTDGLEYTYWGGRRAGAAALRDGRAIKFTTTTGVPVGYMTGRVTDSMTGQPIEHATIRANNVAAGSTNADGNYFIMLPADGDSTRITVSALFYNDSTLSSVEIVAADTSERNWSLLKPLFVASSDTLQFERHIEFNITDSLVVRNEGNGVLFVHAAAGVIPWLRITPQDDTLAAFTSSTIYFEILTDGLADGRYRTNLVISHNARPGSLILPVTLLMALDAPFDPIAEPLQFELSQNFPNPFNSTTTFRFELPSDGHAKVAILDIGGREQARLVEGYHTQGRYSVPFVATDLPAGIYFCRLEAGGRVMTRKLTLIK